MSPTAPLTNRGWTQMNADFRACERNRQRRPAELTTPMFPSQHLSVFIRVYPWFRRREYCAAVSRTVDYIDTSYSANGIISLD